MIFLSGTSQSRNRCAREATRRQLATRLQRASRLCIRDCKEAPGSRRTARRSKWNPGSLRLFNEYALENGVMCLSEPSNVGLLKIATKSKKNFFFL